MITKHGVMTSDLKLKLAPAFDSNYRIYSVSLSSVATGALSRSAFEDAKLELAAMIAISAPIYETEPKDNGLYQHTFTWEAN